MRFTDRDGLRLTAFATNTSRGQLPNLERTREGMAVARAKGRLKGRQPKLSVRQQNELRRMHGTGDYTITDLAELFGISRPTVYRTINRATAKEKVS